MGRFTKKWTFLLVAALLLEVTNASNLRWVAASHGAVPNYAVIGGENFSGEPLYIARVQLNSGKTPGKMAPSYRGAHTSWGEKEHYRANYEILTNPGWKSHLEWKKSSGYLAPPDAVAGGTDAGRTLYVGRFMYADGHMICGKVLYEHGKAYIGYNDKEFENQSFYVLVEHSHWYIRGLSKRDEFPELPGVKQPKRAPILKQQVEYY